MGKKSSDVPPPDPRLIDAQLRSMGVQDEAIQQVMTIAKEQAASTAKLQPLQEEALRFGLETSRTAYDQSQSDREWLLGRRGSLSGLQDTLVKEAADFNTEATTDRMVATATADAGKAMSDMRQARDRELATMGVMPGSGRAASVDRLDEARIVAGAANQGRVQARAEGRALTDRAVNTLAGYPAMASGATGQGAALGGSGVTIANSGVGGISAGYGAMTGQLQAAGGLAGQMGSNATGMYGTQANYKLAADKAAESDLGGIGSIIGAGAQLYKSGIFAGSAREYKEGIVRVGTHSRLGIGLYLWRYRKAYRAKWGDAWRVGVMADELAAVMPQAVATDADGHTVVNYSMI